MLRIDPQPAEIIDRGQRLWFQFEGESFPAHAGDTIASALAAGGIDIFSRGFKYHRPRGLLCVSGKCPNCLVNRNGVPNVRACTQPVHQGDRIASQHCWPSLGSDLLSLIEKFDRFLPVGFYYKTLFRSRLAWKLLEPVIRRLAGLGELDISKNGKPHGRQRHLYTDIVVVGGGPAGLTAAAAACQTGAKVLLIDDQLEWGGHLRFHQRTFPDPDSGELLPGFEIAGNLADQLEKCTSLTILRPAVAFGAYEGNLIAAASHDCLFQIRATQIVLATGSYEYPSVFANNDLPGIVLGTGALRLLHLYGVRPGERAVVVAGDDNGLRLALDLHRAGVEVAAVVDWRQQSCDSAVSRELLQLQIPHLESFAPVRADGRRRVRALTVAPQNSSGRLDMARAKTYDCDLVCLSSNRAPSAELLRQAGGSVSFDPSLNQMTPQGVPSEVQLAGELTGFQDLSIIAAQGRLAGLQAARRLGTLADPLPSELENIRDRLAEAEARYREKTSPLVPLNNQKQGKQFVCLCEDVTRKDITHAVMEGFDEMELLKRYTTASMGPCQGRMCSMPLAACCADETDQTLSETGTTTSRPPVQPVSLAVLAGPHHLPVRLTPMHHQHLQAGASQMDMGEWKRPFSYGPPATEWRAVRERVGLIDLSTLGKLDVQGKDAPQLLDMVYTHVFSTLKVGRIRYGVICGEDGIILDDGTVSRLAEDHYYITTTSGNIEFVESWIEWWAGINDLCAHVTNVTGDFAAVNLAGPKARQVLQKITEVDVSSENFRYMQYAQGEVADIPARLLRIGFVGETGWEIHVPWAYGQYLWEVLMETGAEFGITPFGVEAQRILRLEKKHLIVGQDTDALSNPLEADMQWVVKFVKEDFVGKSVLAHVRDRGLQQKLVGFVCDRLVQEGSAVVVDQKPVGRISSARISPAQNRCVGLAWVPFEISSEGSQIDILHEGRMVPARVYQSPFYDPEGERLRQ